MGKLVGAGTETVNMKFRQANQSRSLAYSGSPLSNMASQVSPNKNPNDHLTVENFQGNKKCRKEKTLGHLRMSGKLHMLYCYAKVALSERVIRITLDKDVFGCEVKIPIHFDDVDIFCRLHPISYLCIAVYIWHLYN
ncbi:hypothetical protein ACS0TY_021379 [Phlomoides rotata]